MRFLVALALAPVSPGGIAGEEAGLRPLKVLWVGNSSTRSGDMPKLLAEMLRHAGIQLVSDEITPGGKGLQFHYSDPGSSARGKIASGTYDAVVIQPGWVDRQDDAALLEYGRKFADGIRAAGAVPILFSPGPRREGLANIAAGAAPREALAREAGYVLAPCADAWRIALEQRPEWKDLWLVKDEVHPSAYGVYVTACTFYAVLTGKTPEGHRVRAACGYGGERAEDGGVRDGAKVVFDEPAAQVLQSAAWKAVQAARGAGHRVGLLREKLPE